MKTISEYKTAYEYADHHGKMPELEKAYDKVKEELSKIEHEVYTQTRLINERYVGYKMLQEVMYDIEARNWQGDDDDEVKKISGECYEIWHSIHGDNAEFLKKQCIEHARKLVVAEDQRLEKEKERDAIWTKQCEERKKGHKVWDEYQEEKRKKEESKKEESN
tara:strand:+ start:45 stop:533 length:489 start_codon:yes stop_codon:yes gene_type:complete